MTLGWGVTILEKPCQRNTQKVINDTQKDRKEIFMDMNLLKFIGTGVIELREQINNKLSYQLEIKRSNFSHNAEETNMLDQINNMLTRMVLIRDIHSSSAI